MDEPYDSDRPRGYTHSRDPAYRAPVNYLAECGKQLALHPAKWWKVLGNERLVEWFVVQVIKETNGRADRDTVETIFKALAKVKAW
jgi:hypothetical protein